MTQLLVIAALIVLAYRALVGRWPWEQRVSVRDRALARARATLGLGLDAGRQEILAAHRRRLTTVHPDRGGSGAGVHEANEARDLLLAELPTPSIHHPEEPQ